MRRLGVAVLALILVTTAAVRATAGSERPAGSVIPAEGLQPAQRLDRDRIRAEQTLVGLHGLPFAPGQLSGCEEFDFYRDQVGLPLHFDAIAYRESGCSNVEHDFACCYGYLQLWVNLHLNDATIGPRYRSECEVAGPGDVSGEEPLAKQKNLCAAAVLFSVVGYSAWAQTA